MAEVELTPPELLLAGIAGVMRQVSAITHGRPPAYSHDDKDPWTPHIEGAASEMATAKYLDRFWSPLASGRLSDLPGDVSTRVQVRSTSRSDGCLIVHPSDHDDHLFYLVLTDDLPRCTIVGSLRGRDAKQGRFWRTQGVRHPAFFVPQFDLVAE
jgi:hypothetical protein